MKRSHNPENQTNQYYQSEMSNRLAVAPLDVGRGVKL